MKTSPGKITAIHGPMFSGKTEELLRRFRRARIAGRKCQMFKPRRDDRYDENIVLPHHLAKEQKSASVGEAAIPVDTPLQIWQALSEDVDLLAIEEAQFFDATLFDLVLKLSQLGIHVILSLLDQDFRRMPFPIAGAQGREAGRNIGDYLAIAHESLKLTAICMRCGAEAEHSQKLVLSGQYPGGQPVYVPASWHDDIVAIGTNLENSQAKLFATHPPIIYEARCRACHEVPDAPTNYFDMLCLTTRDQQEATQ